MADVHEPAVRSYNMSKIRSVNTKPELIVRKYLHSLGFRYRLHVSTLPGKPDIVLPKYKSIVLVHGCFWHSHEGCKRFQVPSTRKDYWIPKLKKNKEKDERNVSTLKKSGWNVHVIWECELKRNKRHETLRNLQKLIRS